MVADTRLINQLRYPLPEAGEVWLFGYGSLIYKVDFPYLSSARAGISGWSRRFWQGSHDHRGTPEAPGRVLTLIETPGAICEGMAYRVSPKVFQHLDEREKNGYLRLELPLLFADQSTQIGIVYLASPNNGAWLGPASELAIAEQIWHAQGPSGLNRDYVWQLAHALDEMAVQDDHVFAIADHLKAIARQCDSNAHPFVGKEY